MPVTSTCINKFLGLGTLSFLTLLKHKIVNFKTLLLQFSFDSKPNFMTNILAIEEHWILQFLKIYQMFKKLTV